MRGIILVPLALLAALMLQGCHVAQRERSSDALIRLADDEAKSLDPQAVSDLASLRIAADQFEGLTRFDGAGRVEPGLAHDWTHSADGLTWRFALRDHLHFSDSAPITAQTFVDVFARLNAPTTAAPAKSLFQAIESVHAEENAVVIHLHHPFPALPDLLAHPALVALPLHRAHWMQERPLVTSGAYRLHEWALNDHITLDRNPAWHDGAAHIAHIRWQPVSDALTALRLFQSGGADVTSDFPSARLAKLRAELPAAVHVAPYNGSYYFVFNTRRPPFNDVRVRRALSMMVDRRWIAGPLLNLGAQPAWSVVPPGIGLAQPYQPDWASWGYARRLAQATALIQAAGYGPTHPLVFDIRYNSDPDHRRVAVVLAAMWKPLNVDAHLLNAEASLHFASLRRGDFSLARSGWIGDLAAPENYLGLFRSTAGAVNYAGYANPAFDAALGRAEAIADPARRAQAMRAADAIMEADAPVIPISYYVSKSLVAKRVGGWQDSASNIHPSRTLWMK